MAKRTYWNPKHPHNVMHQHGQDAKAHVRKMSNAQLDAFLKEHMSEEGFEEIKGKTRKTKIEFVKFSAMGLFADKYNKQVEENAGK